MTLPKQRCEMTFAELKELFAKTDRAIELEQQERQMQVNAQEKRIAIDKARKKKAMTTQQMKRLEDFAAMRQQQRAKLAAQQQMPPIEDPRPKTVANWIPVAIPPLVEGRYLCWLRQNGSIMAGRIGTYWYYPNAAIWEVNPPFPEGTAIDMWADVLPPYWTEGTK